MKKTTNATKVSIEIEFTDGYQERFTNAILKIYEKRIRQENHYIGSKDDKSA